MIHLLWTIIWLACCGATEGDKIHQMSALSRLTNLVASGSQAAGYAYDGVGNLQALRYGNGVTNLYQYDILNRLTNLTWKLNATTLASHYYQLGRAGNRTNLSELLNGTSRTYAWTYDSLYRLKQESLSGGTSGSVTYGYDLVSNRTNRASTLSGLTNQNFTFNTNDWLTAGSYDSNGNTTASSGNTYQYDPLNHLTNCNNGAVLLWYDGDGNRVRKTAGATTTLYLVDDRNLTGYAQVLEEWTGTGGTTNLSRVYNYGLQPISQKQGGTTHYFAHDGHGSTRLLLDIAGAVSQWFVFDAYGSLVASNVSPTTPLLYCGEYLDSNLGTYYLRARILNPGTGRFLTRDPAQGRKSRPVSLHSYLYGDANPVNMADPAGQMSEIQSLTTAMTMFALASATYVAVDRAMDSARGTLRPIQIANRRYAPESGPESRPKPIPIPPYLPNRSRDDEDCPTLYISKTFDDMPQIAQHIEDAQNAGPYHSSVELHVGDRTEQFRIANRRAVLKGKGSAGTDASGSPLEWDEYPFASTKEGGDPKTASVRAVPWLEQRRQGGVVNAFYNAQVLMPGDCFYVRIIP
jgi:RHS repeat-associated protein